MHEGTWRTAERLLNEAKTWVFIGYSLPAAGYEFKHLLKRVQLARKSPAKLFLVTGGGAKAARETQRNYQRFFGHQLKSTSGKVFLEGLNSSAIAALQDLGALATEERADGRGQK